MRYPDGGGLIAAGRERREKVRLQAAALFEKDMPPVQVAHQLRVSAKSAYQWRRCWRAGGTAELASKGAGGAVCRLSSVQLARLRTELDAGPAVHGWAEDQRWTLERVTTAHDDWLTVAWLPAYAPELNPVVGAWSTMKNSMGNLGPCSTPR
jgi:transposase